LAWYRLKNVGQAPEAVDRPDAVPVGHPGAVPVGRPSDAGITISKVAVGMQGVTADPTAAIVRAATVQATSGQVSGLRPLLPQRHDSRFQSQ